MAGVLSCFVVLFFYEAWNTAGMALGVWVLFFMGLGLFDPARLEKVYRAWMKFGLVVGSFNYKLILVLMYLVIFTPVRIVTSCFRKDPLTRKIEPDKKTYWYDRETACSDPKRFERQY